MSADVMIVAGEASGDLHGSRLVRAMGEIRSGLCFCGIGGSELAACGVELLYDASKIAVVGLVEVATHLGDIITAQKRLRRRMAERRPALLILIDFPDFNLLLARQAKRLGVPVFYYISPQVWAWRAGRVRKIGRLTDGIGVILPFEEQFYQERGVTAHYVGHPLLDTVSASASLRGVRRRHGLAEDATVIGILPGSRIKEIRLLLPIFLRAAEIFRQRAPGSVSFLLPLAPTISEEDLVAGGLETGRGGLDLRIVAGDRYDMIAACDAVITASGTVTLECLLLDVPMVVAYKLSPLSYLLGRLVVDIDYFSLVNLIAGDLVVPELLQAEANPERIAAELLRLTGDSRARTRMLAGYGKVRRRLGKPGASRRAAELALSVADAGRAQHDR